MKVRCERDKTEFETEPLPYPSAEHQSKNYYSNGDSCIHCPTCGRGYFRRDEKHLAGNPHMPNIVTGPEPKAGDFVSDRVLTVL